MPELGRALGLSEPTVYAWSGAKAPGSAGKFRQLAVVPTRGGQNAESQADDGNGCESRGDGARWIVVRGPAGIAVHGMSVSDVAELFRRLGC